MTDAAWRKFAALGMAALLLVGCESADPGSVERAKAEQARQSASADPTAETRLGPSIISNLAPAVRRPSAPAASSPPAALRPTETPDLRPPKKPRKEQIVLGKNRIMTAQLDSESRNDPSQGDRDKRVLNFVDTDIREVVRTVLGDILARNYVIDPAVQGSITLQSSGQLDEDSLLATLETVLQVNGAALVRKGPLYQVVPLIKAPSQAGSPSLGAVQQARRQGYGIQVVPLQYVSATEMQKVLEPLAPEGSVLRADSQRNLLVLGGPRQDMANMLDAVKLFDVNWIQGTSFGLFPLQFADAALLAEELEQILGQDSEAEGGQVLRVVAIERLNSVLVITRQREYLREARNWIKRLDQSDETERKLFVYYVQNGRAKDLAEVINKVFSGEESTEPSDSDLLSPNLERSTSSIRGGRQRDGFGFGGRRDSQSSSGDDSRSSRSVLAEGRDSGGQGAADAGPEVQSFTFTAEDQVRIIADDANNALVILATPTDYRMVLDAVEKLDIVPLQVLVEATIAEVTLNDELNYGVQWFLDTQKGNLTFSALDTGAISAAFPGFSYLFTTANQRVVLNALNSVTDVNVISSPSLMVLDNKTARLQVGDEVPVATQSAVSVTDPDAPIVNSIQFVDTGVILDVTPRVNSGGLVVMDIEQEVSDAVATETSGIDSPTIQQRRVASSLAVQSGETVALGGLIREFKTDTKSGIPVLMNIPYVGALFRETTEDVRRTELIVLITPRAVRSKREAREVTDELKERMRAVEPLSKKIQ